MERVVLDASAKYQLMQRAWEKSKYSSCVSRQVGCVIMTPDQIMIEAYNEMPKTGRCGDYQICRCFDPEREPGKDLQKAYAAHAEQKAIGYAAREGVPLMHSVAVVTDLPCNDCAKLLIEAGIATVIFERDYPHSEAPSIFERAGVKLERFFTMGEEKDGREDTV